jgi:hypothetical protein
VAAEHKAIPDHSCILGYGLGGEGVPQSMVKESLQFLVFSALGGHLGDFRREYIHAALFGIFCKAADGQLKL